MGKCLITKLSGVVQNEDLLEIGELEIILKGNSSSGKRMPSFSFTEATVIKAINGLITAENANNGNKAQELNISSSSGNMSCFADGEVRLRVQNKYNLVTLYEQDSDAFADLEIDLADLKYCKSLTRLNIGLNKTVKGSLEDIKDLPITDIFLNPETPSDLANVKGWTLTYHAPEGVLLSNVYGDTSNIHTSFASTVKLTVRGTKGKSLYGDLGKLGDKIKIFVSNGDTNMSENFTWSSSTVRPSSYSFLPIYNVRFATGKDVDNYLINAASCNFDSGHDKNIIIFCTNGTRSHESDTALATIKSNGYTVYLNRVTL